METAAIQHGGGSTGPPVEQVPIEQVIKRIDQISTLPHVAISVTIMNMISVRLSM